MDPSPTCFERQSRKVKIDLNFRNRKAKKSIATEKYRTTNFHDLVTEETMSVEEECRVCVFWIAIAALMYFIGANEYVRETKCIVTNYSFERGWDCDMDDGDNGIYNHDTSFKQDCNQKVYHIHKECVGYYFYTHEIGDIHRCWTDHNCSMEALWNNDPILWLTFIAPWIGYFSLTLSCIIFIDLLYQSVTFYDLDTS